MSACADFSMNMFLFTQTDGRYEGTDTDTGGSQVADFIDFQAGVKPSGTRQNIFYLVCCYRIQTAAKGVELDKFQILLGLYKLSSFVKPGVIHPLVGDDERTLNLGQMGHTVLGQYSNTIGSDQFRNTMVDFFINVIWTSGQDNSLHMVIPQVFDRFLAFILHILTGFGKFRPGGVYGIFDFLRTDICSAAELFRHSLNNMFFIIQGEERIHKPDMFRSQFFHVVFYVFRIRSNDRTIVMVVGAFHLIPFIRNAWIENEVHTVFDQPHDMSMDQLGRIAYGFTRDGFDTQRIDISGRLRAQNNLVAQFCKEGKPEWIVFIHIQYARNTHFTPSGLIFRQRFILENTFVFIIK